MKKLMSALMVSLLSMGVLAGCGNNISATSSQDKIVFVWYPNESGGDVEEARNAIGEIVKKATGKEVEHKLTTDYAIAIETIANDKAALSFMGPQGYVEAHDKNKAVLPLVVPSGASGTLDDAVYYAWLAVNEAEAVNYKSGDSYAIDNIQGKKMSFVSNSSTSGFKVPTSGIISYFGKQDTWKDLTAEDLMEGGSDKFFSEVLFGGSHQGSAVNLLSGKADVAAFCDTVLANYADVASGEANAVGAIYKVKANAEEPFNTVEDKTFTIISSTPVLNSPIVINTNVLTEDEQQKLIEAFTSEEVTNNEKVFVPKDSEGKGFFSKSDKEQFVATEDSWFEPIRNLSK